MLCLAMVKLSYIIVLHKLIVDSNLKGQLQENIQSLKLEFMLGYDTSTICLLLINQ